MNGRGWVCFCGAKSRKVWPAGQPGPTWGGVEHSRRGCRQVWEVVDVVDGIHKDAFCRCREPVLNYAGANHFRCTGCGLLSIEVST